jgi:hypothetical protein
MKLLERIHKIFKTDEEALNFFLENTETLFVCKLCKNRFVIKKRKILIKYCCYEHNEFQNTHVFFSKTRMKFRQNLAFLYYLYHLYQIYSNNFQKKFTRSNLSRHVVQIWHAKFPYTKKRFSIIKPTQFLKYDKVFTKLAQMLKKN